MKSSTKLLSVKILLPGLAVVMGLLIFPLTGATPDVEPTPVTSKMSPVLDTGQMLSLGMPADREIILFDDLMTSVTGPSCGPGCYYICTGSVCPNGKQCAQKCYDGGVTCTFPYSCVDVCFI